MELKFVDLKHNQDIWLSAFTFSNNPHTFIRTHLDIKPVAVRYDKDLKSFVHIDTNGDLLPNIINKSMLLKFFDTYTDCSTFYNQRVKNAISSMDDSFKEKADHYKNKRDTLILKNKQYENN